MDSNDNLCSLSIDMHVHTKYSKDAIIEPKKIKTKLDGLAITDHNTIKGGLEVQKYLKDKIVIVGSEIDTNYGEIIGLFLNEEIKSRDFFIVVDEIHDQDGIIVVPHPFDTIRKRRLKILDNVHGLIDCIEVWNSRCINIKHNKEAQNFAEKYNKCMTGGSDSHFHFEIGNAYTIFQTNDIRYALINNKTQVFGTRTNLIAHGFSILKKKLHLVTKEA